MSKESMVTIPIEEYDRLRELDKTFNKGSFIVHKRLVDYMFGKYDSYIGFSKEESIKMLNESYNKVINGLQDKIDNLESSLRKPKKWYQL